MPSSTVIGLVFCIVRIMFCVCPSHCISKRERNKKSAKVDADHRTSLLGDTKRVSIARGPYINVSSRLLWHILLTLTCRCVSVCVCVECCAFYGDNNKDVFMVDIGVF